jgi:hypothetical protein
MKRTALITWYKFVHKQKRYIPLIIALWLPFTILLNAIAGMNATVMMVSGICSAITLTVLGYVVYTCPSTHKLKYAPVVI